MPDGTADVLTYIAVGSNIDPARNIATALEHLQQHMDVVDVSTFYQTKPIGRPDQPDYRNGIFVLRNAPDPLILRDTVLRPIEVKLGRIRSTDSYAARTIDLDIILHGDTVLKNDTMIIPDPDISQRSFIALPLAELAPDLVLPGTDTALNSICARWQLKDLVPDNALTRTLKARLTS